MQGVTARDLSEAAALRLVGLPIPNTLTDATVHIETKGHPLITISFYLTDEMAAALWSRSVDDVRGAGHHG